jgi:hypothetical protein
MSQPPTPGPQPGFEPSQQPPPTGLEQPVSQQLQPVPGPAQQPDLGRMVLVGVIAGALGIGLGAAVGASRNPTTTAMPAATVTVTATATATTTVRGEPTDRPTDEPTDTSGTFTPHKTDFQIGITILQKTCLGSASCSISFRIEPTYVGRQELPSTGTVEVTYRILGAEDPIENTYLIVDGQASYDKEEVASTSSPATQLSATVIDVSYTE